MGFLDTSSKGWKPKMSEIGLGGKPSIGRTLGAAAIWSKKVLVGRVGPPIGKRLEVKRGNNM